MCTFYKYYVRYYPTCYYATLWERIGRNTLVMLTECANMRTTNKLRCFHMLTACLRTLVDACRCLRLKIPVIFPPCVRPVHSPLFSYGQNHLPRFSNLWRAQFSLCVSRCRTRVCQADRILSSATCNGCYFAHEMG